VAVCPPFFSSPTATAFLLDLFLSRFGDFEFRNKEQREFKNAIKTTAGLFPQPQPPKK
jgi:hypothetical protein